MKYPIIFKVGLCLLIAAAPAIAQSAADEASIKEALTQLETAYNKHDEKAVAGLWGETAIEYRRETKGREAIEKRIAGIFDRHKRSIQYKVLEELGFAFLTPDVALVRQRVVFTNRFDEGGESLPDNNELVAFVFVKKNNTWKMRAILENTIDE